jgi:uncharacterized membrane protein YidH (DUF202 family)
VTGDHEQSAALVADGGLQQERTALAWERTAISLMVVGLLLTRYASRESQPVMAIAGLATTVAGGVVLAWAGLHYADLHGPINEGHSVVHPAAARLVGVVTVTFSGVTLAFALLVGVS